MISPKTTGKSRHHPHNNQREIITRLIKNTQSRDQFTDGLCPDWTVGDKDQTQVFFKTGVFPPFQ